MADKPAKKFRLGFVTATVWKNSSNNGDTTFYNVVLSRSYKTDSGSYEDTDQLGVADLLNAAKLLERSEAWISEQAK